MDEFAIGVLSNVGMLSFLALSAYLLLVAGEISFGQQAFFALGAYGAGIGTAVWGWPLPAALAWGAALGSAAAALVGALTLRLRGMYFAVATLAFAEAVRIALELFRYQAQVGGEPVGPDGTEGFRGIRYVLEHDIGPGQYLAMIWALLTVAVALVLWAERSRAGRVLRMVGEDEALAAMQGVDVVRVKLAAAAAAGLLAGLGGGLYAHLMTYVEPRNFDIMLGVHSLAYGLIGGLGSALGPLLGVAIDIGLLESTRWFSGYRMIVFGGLVAVLLIVRPRGLLDERLVHRIRLARRRKLHAVH